MAKAKKILIDARMYGLENSGIGRYLIHLIEELQKVNDKNKYVLLLRKRYFNVLKLSKNWTKVLADFRHYTLKEQIMLPKLIKEQSPDLVHFPHFNIPFFWQRKFVVTIHDMTMHQQGTKASNLPLPIFLIKRVPYIHIFKKAVKDSVKIITPTKAVKQGLMDYFKINGDKITSIYEGINKIFLMKVKTKVFLKKFDIKGKYFIYTGNAHPHKNLERAVEAVKLLNKYRKEKITFVIAGSRDVFVKQTEAFVNSLGAGEFVKMLGFVPDEDLVRIYKKAIGFVYPSLSEGFGLQGLETMASGTLLLASDIPVFKEVYKENPIYFNPYDFTSMAKAMEEALDMDENKRKMVIKKAQKFVRNYSWTKMAKKTLKVYQEVL